jgi:hypothetical protein
MNRRLFQWLSLGAVLGVSVWAIGATWDATYEAIPDGTSLAADLDTVIKSFKLETRNRASTEDIWGTGSDDNALHRLGSARAFIQNAAPTDLVGPGQYNSAAGAFGGTPLSTEELGASVIDIGAGRLWVDLDGLDTLNDLDDRQLNVWNETSNTFVPVLARDPGSAGIGATNLIYNGSFEVTDGTGATGSTAVPAGWTAVAPAPTFSYKDPTGVSEGEGLAVDLTGTGASGAISQTLAGLKASTIYVFRVRANPTTAADSCALTVTGGVTTPTTDTSAVGTAVYETLEASVTTTAGPASLVVKLVPVANTDVCRFDTVTVFEKNANVAPAGLQAIYTQDIVNDATIDTTFTNNVYLTTGVTIPSPGYIVQVDVSLSVGMLNATMLTRISRDCGGGFVAVTPVTGVQSEPAVQEFVQNVAMSYVDTGPTVGATCSYRVEVREGVADTTEVNPVSFDGAVQTGSSLRLLLIPTG